MSTAGDLDGDPLAQLLRQGSMRAHYQPIVRLSDGEVVAHESLIRLPQEGSLRTPDQLFQVARYQGKLVQVEQVCVDAGIRHWKKHSNQLLFLNMSAHAVIEMVERLGTDGLIEELGRRGMAPQSITIEITEHDHVSDAGRLIEAANRIRAHGMRFALDDFGDGRSSLRLWSELRPEFVKIDKYFCLDVETNAVKVQTLRGLQRFAEIFGTQLIAEGIESAAVLQVVRDLGLPLGQGYFLGRPAETPVHVVNEAALGVLQEARIAVLPEPSRAGGSDVKVERIRVWVTPQSDRLTVQELADLFAEDPHLFAVPLVKDGQTVAVVSRQSFVDRCARPYFRDLFGRDSCLQFANRSPMSIERHAGLSTMMEVLTSPDQSYLTDGLVVTENGRYAGLARGDHLVRLVTEIRIEAARHANPLTFLPGNIPINEHICRLLDAGHRFVACYADLNHFKPFNDHYGYWQGDEMIRLAAKTLQAHADPRHDFVGHVGGDDFLVLFQSADWAQRCDSIVHDFNEQALALFDTEARKAGGILAEDRDGVQRFFPFTTIALGVVVAESGQFHKPEEVANAAAAAKHQAKFQTHGGERSVAVVHQWSRTPEDSVSRLRKTLSEAPRTVGPRRC